MYMCTQNEDNVRLCTFQWLYLNLAHSRKTDVCRTSKNVSSTWYAANVSLSGRRLVINKKPKNKKELKLK